jgi:hypothetical protein
MDCKLQYHARMVLLGKHAKAVKRMVVDSCGVVRFRCQGRRPISGRTCPAALCRRGTAPLHAIGAKPFSVKGLFQHMSGI